MYHVTVIMASMIVDADDTNFMAVVFSCFFFNDPATTEIYTLSLHDALPIWSPCNILGVITEAFLLET